MPETPPQVDTVVLDVDGTLVDTNYHHTLAWARAFAAVGHDVPLWRIHRSIGMGGDRLVPHLIGEAADAECGDRVRELWKKEYDALIDETRALPGARELLDRLGERSVKVVMASSGKPEHTQHALRLLGVDEADGGEPSASNDPAEPVDDVSTSKDAPSKPAPDLVDKAIAEVDGEHAVLVGDSVWDAQAAKRAGVPMVGLLTGGFGAAELLDAGAVAVHESLGDLVEGLDELLGRTGGAR